MCCEGKKIVIRHGDEANDGYSHIDHYHIVYLGSVGTEEVAQGGVHGPTDERSIELDAGWQSRGVTLRCRQS